MDELFLFSFMMELIMLIFWIRIMDFFFFVDLEDYEELDMKMKLE